VQAVICTNKPFAASGSETHLEKRISFRGGAVICALPLVVFIAITIVLLVNDMIAVEGMIIAAMLGISLGMLPARSMAQYSERVFSLMANRIVTVAIICWLWAGAFSGILAESGLVEAIVWLGWKLDLNGAAFVLAVFICSSLFAVSVGSAFVTVVSFTTVMYPAGILLGAASGPLMGAILSGAAFGDNVSPVSDTTIISAATQETDVGGVVRSRLKYALTAGAIAGVLFYLFGAGENSVNPTEAEKLVAEYANPKALPMLIPGIIVFITAIRGYHFFTAINLGIASAVLIGSLTGIFPLEQVFHLTADGTVAGSAVSGVLAMLPVSILVLLLITIYGILQDGGFFELFLGWIDRYTTRSKRGVESVIVALISLANLCVPGNTTAMITAGPLANEIRKNHGIHPYRSANLLDTISCSFPFLLPYATIVIAAGTIQAEVASIYPFVPVLSWEGTAPFVFYGIVLFPLMILSVITGVGSRKG